MRQRRAGWQSAAGRAAVPAAGRAVKRAAEQPAALCRVARLPGPPSACCREGASENGQGGAGVQIALPDELAVGPREPGAAPGELS